MKSVKRLSLALSILFAGLALVPYVALPNESFSWRLFAGLYGATPALGINYTTGAPGSFFTVTGYNFPVGQTVTIAANGRNLGTVQANDTGTFSFVLASDNADTGTYRISANGQTATVRLDLVRGAPLRPREGDASLLTLYLPRGIAETNVYLPVINR